MTAITVKHFSRVTMFLEDSRDFTLLLKRLQAIPAILFPPTRDVQVESIATSRPIQQAVIDKDGFLVSMPTSSIVVNVVQVHELSKETNNLAASAALHVLRGTMKELFASASNVFVIQNGTNVYGWAEGAVSPKRAMNVVRIIDAYWNRTLTREVARERLRVVLIG